MMYERLALMKELLSDKGSIWVHCSEGVVAHLRLLLADVFGEPLFQNIVSWRRTYAGKTIGRKIPANVDYIIWYARTPNFQYHPIRKPFTQEDIEQFTKDDGDGRGPYSTVAMQKVSGPTPGTAYDYTDKKGRIWKCPTKGWRVVVEKMRDLENDNRLYFGGATIREKYYLAERMEIGKQVDNFWGDIGNINRNKSEDVGYATQKPEALIERIVTACSSEGDLVADFFCGSGTTGAVAERLGLRWIMADLGRFAIHTSRKRLIELQRTLHAEGKPYRAFDVYNLGRYERQWWQRDRLKGADEEHRRVVLEFFKAEVLENTPSPLIHGRKSGAYCHVDGIDSIFSRGEAKAVAEAVRQAGGKQCYCLAWEFEMDLRLTTAALEKELRVKLMLIQIPREIMEKNRKNPPPFLEMAVLEAEPVYQRKGKETNVDIKITKFVPSLAEVPSKELEALKERAIKSGVDFIDFWAVDFEWEPGKPFNHHWQDYRTRKERSLKTVSDAGYVYEKKGKHTACVKVIDTFGCDTSITVEVEL